MKKIVVGLLSGGFLTSVTPVLAQVKLNITPPPFGVPANTPLGDLINSALSIVFIVAALLVLVYLIWGAFQWITSGGDKEGIGKARDKIIQALVGLVILALAFLIVRVVGQIVGINILNITDIPKLGQPVVTPTPRLGQ